eukprot:SAG11_NODE_128_length_15542_cov_6.432105_2_plen_645_part_00
MPQGGWFNTSLRTDSAMGEQLAALQAEFDVPWDETDMDASWLGNRLLLFPYILEPSVNLTKPRLFYNGLELNVTEAYNSRGNHQSKCFLGWFFGPTTAAAADGDHKAAWPVPLPDSGAGNFSIWLPEGFVGSGSSLNGIFWNGLRDGWTTELLGVSHAGNLSTCAANSDKTMPAKPPPGAKNVLYLLVDDLRPQLSIYGQTQMHTPNVERLAKAGTVFEHAYCQIAVCSPSRMSFMSGRRPGTSGIYNFKNHIRQAQCPSAVTQTAINGSEAFLREVTVPQNMGAAGECCTQCTNDPACKSFSFYGGTNSLKPQHIDAYACKLYRASMGSAAAPTVEAPMGVISGNSGVWDAALWTAHPQQFRKSGYLTLSTGKVWHTEEGGLSMGSPGAGVNGGEGTGMPPNQDPPCWSEGCSMAGVNAVAAMWNCDRCNSTSTDPADGNCKPAGSQGCPLASTTDSGVVTDPEIGPLCDKTIGDDAVAKLQLASAFTARTGRPWFLAAGFRKPHMPWRFPKRFLQYYPAAAEIELAAHPTMDASVPPIAHHTPDLQAQAGGDPYHTMPNMTAQWDRLSYYAAVSWTDSQIGRVLDELETLQMKANTLIILHSDHGWNLGEHGQWWVQRIPWLPPRAVPSVMFPLSDINLILR